MVGPRKSVVGARKSVVGTEKAWRVKKKRGGNKENVVGRSYRHTDGFRASCGWAGKCQTLVL